MIIQGRVWVFKDDDINTDLIFPGKYTYEPLRPEEQAIHAMEDYDPEFVKLVRKHDILLTGKNFGCGSSREQAVTCLKHAGIDAVVAESFARLFYRNSINSALASIECPGVIDAVFKQEKGQGSKLTNLEMKINLSEGKIFLASQEYSFPPWDEHAMLIYRAGGLVEYTKKRLQNK